MSCFFFVISLLFPLSFLPLVSSSFSQSKPSSSITSTPSTPQPSQAPQRLSNPKALIKTHITPKTKNNENLIPVLFFSPRDTSPPLCLFWVKCVQLVTFCILQMFTSTDVDALRAKAFKKKKKKLVLKN